MPTASRNQRSWATRTIAASSPTSVCSSHSSDSMSRWFVGSSSSSRSGCAASARASEARVSWPPENVEQRAVEVRVGEAEAVHDGRGALAPARSRRRPRSARRRRRSGRAPPRRPRAIACSRRAELGLELERLAAAATGRSRAARGRARAAGAGRAARRARPWRTRARRRRSTVSPASIRSSVVLPAPLRPAIVIRSRRSSLNETPRSSGSPAMSLARSERSGRPRPHGR